MSITKSRGVVGALALVGLLASSPARADNMEGLRDVMSSVVSVLPRTAPGQANKEEPEGSGVVIFEGRHILTARHVLTNAQDILVRTFDGVLHQAQVRGQDPATDLALLEITAELKPIDLGDDPKIGEEACAIGNAFGLGLSLTCGLVSAVNRTGTGFNPVEDFVQTDAAVNPGSSGGALVNKYGRLVGVLSAIFTKSADANIGVNFAVSTALARRVATDLRAGKKVKWNFGGAGLGAIPQRGGLGRMGAEVLQVRPGSAAEKAGLKPGDIIRHVDERRIRKPRDFRSAMARLLPGEDVEIKFERDNEEERVTLTAQ
ncbi:MAG: PDZ domain-containing protein [Alphaproteobacteria bacterium]|nr:PDZ domain-containing protein [Alphaproteobacteria bacterium]